MSRAEQTRRTSRPWLPMAVVTLVAALIAGLLAQNTTTPSARADETADAQVSIWPTAVPQFVDSGDRSAVEVGVKFRASVAGTVTGIRFYKSTANTGTHTGGLWSVSGERLATVTFTAETESGWQSAAFDTAIIIQPNTTYLASYFAPEGGFAVDPNYFSTAAYTNGPLTALQDGTDGANGMYRYGGVSGFPDQPSASANYWVDVLFVASVPALPTPSVTETPAPGPDVSAGARDAAQPARLSVRAFDSANLISDVAWFQQAYAAGFRLYVMHSTRWGTCEPWEHAVRQMRMALEAGLKVAAYTRDPQCWKGGIEAAGYLAPRLQFFALDAETGGVPVTREMVEGVQAMGVRPVIYTGSGMWSKLQGASVNDFSDIPLWDGSIAHVTIDGWQADFLAPPPVRYAGWNTPSTMRIGVQQHMEFRLNGVNVDLNSFDAGFLTVP